MCLIYEWTYTCGCVEHRKDKCSYYYRDGYCNREIWKARNKSGACEACRASYYKSAPRYEEVIESAGVYGRTAEGVAYKIDTTRERKDEVWGNERKGSDMSTAKMSVKMGGLEIWASETLEEEWEERSRFSPSASASAPRRPSEAPRRPSQPQPSSSSSSRPSRQPSHSSPSYSSSSSPSRPSTHTPTSWAERKARIEELQKAGLMAGGKAGGDKCALM